MYAKLVVVFNCDSSVLCFLFLYNMYVVETVNQ